MARRLIPAHLRPDAAAVIAGLLAAEWAHLHPGWDHPAATAELLSHDDAGRPPQTWLLFEDPSRGPDGHVSPDREKDSADSQPEGLDNSSVIGSVGLALDGELGNPTQGTSDPSGVWLVNLYVIPSARRRGHGIALLDHGVEAARSLGLRDLLLTTELSADFYARRGWEHLGTTVLNGHDCAVMTLAIVTA